MFAVIKTGGKQYRVAANETLQVEKLAGEAGEIVTFGEVLMLGGETPQVGAPFVGGASVLAEIVEHARGRKIIVFKKRRRQNSRRRNGHRQDFTLVRITDILAAGEQASPRSETRGGKRAAQPEAAVDESLSANAATGGAGTAGADTTEAKPKARRAKKEEAGPEGLPE